MVLALVDGYVQFRYPVSRGEELLLDLIFLLPTPVLELADDALTSLAHQMLSMLVVVVVVDRSD